jgi:aminopeptidase 2
MPISALRTHTKGIEALYGWMTDNWDEISKRFPAGLSMLGSIVGMCTSSFSTYTDVERVQGFFADKSTKGFDQALAQSLDAIRAKAAWLERDTADVKQWVEANQGKKVKSEL